MNRPIEYQTINDGAGRPLFVVVPYEEFMELRRRVDEDELIIPHEVVHRHVMEEKTMLRSWREYVGMTAADMARAVGLPLDEYERMEGDEEPPRERLEKAAAILGVDARLLVAG